MAEHRILRQGRRDEIRRMALREAEDRYRNELMNPDERLVVLERVFRLRRQLRLRS
jgi:hypothetical protein